MKTYKISRLLLITFLFAFSACQEKQTTSVTPEQKANINDFVGNWTIAIQDGSVGWLQVKQEAGYIDANLLWQGGSVLPVPYIYLAGNTLYVGHDTRTVERARKYDGDESSEMNYPDWLQIQKSGDKITGYNLRARTDGVGLDSTAFTGTKLPDPGPAPDLTALKYGQPITLFNGKDLTGWEPLDPNRKSPFHVKDGVLIKDPQPGTDYTDIRTQQVFKDFNLKIDVRVPAAHNSGIYLRGMYEVQVEQGHADSGYKDLDSHNLGGIYSRIAPTVNAEKPAGTWQTFDITLCQRHVTVILNGTKIIDNQPLDGPTGGAIISDVFAPGPILLQGGEVGSVDYRNIVLTPIED